jgi:putative spermidine/putrescine transport system ATP-binding protein/spermidine/putrescine transport system ATP-binding protein
VDGIELTNDLKNIEKIRAEVGMVFQHFNLFPHLTILENLTLGPVWVRKIPKKQAEEIAMQNLEKVHIAEQAQKFPGQLSGGQQQRIALARAIVIEPDVLLLDEPLSALDANLREEMRVELKAIQHRIGVTSIFVTHDQSEALAMSDKIIVMSAGKVQQVGAPEDVYNNPANEFVANFLGASNILDVRVVGSDRATIGLEAPHFGVIPVLRARAINLEGAKAGRLVIRAEKLKLLAAADTGAGVSAQGVVRAVDYQGQIARYFVHVGDQELQIMNMIDGRPFSAGDAVNVSIDPKDCSVLPAES